ncbi:hypothetical protein [Rathayibacter sp. AY1F9]|jgi:hypothetical protein|uniref:hypothetical protein n=1 Tax=Rathayibacter sp. AY1F9 TaxID=2080563 RepID=UPI000CE7BA4D|nr:hypothetical protein [Rathayibacter sp. AY1F9]PPH27147.1 hypothetical protein C5C37_14475 [Rathayibacter sp. AY1F9]
MAEEHDEVMNDTGQALRVAIAVAAQMADKFARAREEMAREAQRRSEQEQRGLQLRFEGERDVAANRLALVERPEFWDRANVDQIARMHETAQQWKDFDPRAEAASETIAREVQERYGVDVNSPGAAPEDVRAALARAELNREQAASENLSTSERGSAAVEFVDAVDAVREANRLDDRADNSLARADDAPTVTDAPTPDQFRIDQAAALELQAREYDVTAEQGGTSTHTPDELRELATDARSQAQLYRDEAPTPTAEPAMAAPAARSAAETSAASDQGRASAERNHGAAAYDSAEHRTAMAAELKAHGIPQEAIDVRMRATIAQGKPVSEAVPATPGAHKVNVPQTTPSRTANRSRQTPEQSL